MNLSDNLKKIRKENDLSQEQLAEKLGVSRQSVSKWESGIAYPEMDKMLQLCKMFNINIDELLNQDIKEVNNTKQAKNSVNKFIDDFLDYISKVVDMFGSMTFKEKIKCIFEQFVLIFFFSLMFTILGGIAAQIISRLINFLPSNVYSVIFHIFEGIYLTLCLIVMITLILHIFKTRYLDYYVVVNKKEETINNIENNKIILDNKKERIIIRDPEHSGYKFVSSMLKILLYMVKAISIFICLSFCGMFVYLIVLLVISFLIVKSGSLFIGVLLGLISSITINFIVIKKLYNFIINKKSKRKSIAILFIISLILLGIGIGICCINFTKFNIKSGIDSKYLKTEEYIYDMKEDTIIHGQVNYIESDNTNIKIIYNHTEFSYLDRYQENNEIFLYNFNTNYNEFDILRKVIDNINNYEIIDYGNYKIDVYTTKENIQILKNNLNKFHQL